MARGSGNAPKAPPPPSSRPTVRLPGERQLFFQKLRGSERTVCAPQGQVGKWSRRRRGEEAKGGERGAPLPRQVPALGSCPSVFNPLGRVGRASKGKGIPQGKLQPGPKRAATHPPPITAFPSPRKCGAELGARRHPGGGRGRRARKGPCLRTALPFFRSPTISSFPRPGYYVPSAVGGGGGPRPLPPALARPSPPVLPAHFLLTSGAGERHAIYSIRIFKPAAQGQGLGRGSSSARARGGGWLGADLGSLRECRLQAVICKETSF